MLSSLVGSFAGIACNHPFDTIRNRLYTRPDEYALRPPNPNPNPNPDPGPTLT